MKIFKYSEFNESILGDISRKISPKRNESDSKFEKLISDIYDDYIENDQNLKKVNIVDDGGNTINFEKIEIGKSYSLSYVFGKYHQVKRNLFTGNVEAGDRRIKITKIPFSIAIKKNELEKMFGTSRVSMGKCRVEDKKTINNYDRNPNIGNHGLYKEIKDEYYISSDYANSLFNFFYNEYNSKYPELKSSRYKSSNSINDIEKGVSPISKFISATTKDGKSITVTLRSDENESDKRKMVSNMTEKEYDIYYKNNVERLYAPSAEKQKNEKNKLEASFMSVLDKTGVDLPIMYGGKKIDFRYYGGDDLVVSAGPIDKSTIDKLKKSNLNFDGFKLLGVYPNETYNNKELFYVAIKYEKI